MKTSCYKPFHHLPTSFHHLPPFYRLPPFTSLLPPSTIYLPSTAFHHLPPFYCLPPFTSLLPPAYTAFHQLPPFYPPPPLYLLPPFTFLLPLSTIYLRSWQSQKSQHANSYSTSSKTKRLSWHNTEAQLFTTDTQLHLVVKHCTQPGKGS